MAIPDFESIMLPLLDCVAERTEWSMSDVEQKLVEKFNLSDEDRIKLKPSSTTETIFQNRMRWARFYLKKAGLLEDPRRSYTRITSIGIKVLEEKPEKIDIKYLMKFEPFVEFYTKKKPKDSTISIAVDANIKQSPEDMIITGFDEIRSNLENEILDKVKSCTPDFFERLVLTLLAKMGYGDGTPTGRSGDGGIDGVIKEDHLGLSEIYIQAKKWEANVPSKEVRDFAGALSGTKSKKGIFITTSGFSPDSKDFVKKVDSKIVLIDGEQLASLIVEHNIGVQAGDTYQLKKIDEDFFS